MPQYETLLEAGQPLSPEELFERVGLKADEQSESVAVFYEELAADVEAALIVEKRLDHEHVLLEALVPSAEALVSMAKKEIIAQAQKADLIKKTMDGSTLYNV